MIASQDVGRRVVVRRTAGFGEHGRPLFTDLLGDLVELNATSLTVRTRDGALHHIPMDEVVAGRPVPPARPGRSRRR
jgi:N-acetylglutamate synthase